MAERETLAKRVTRLEEATIRVDNALSTLAESEARLNDQMATLGKETDGRIQKLVIAIADPAHGQGRTIILSRQSVCGACPACPLGGRLWP
jgi:hypothetical protein